ncbi:hypothetical protein [Alishewanella tabrizica]|uniref:DNA repair ATPase n=1 Tax=Alishewanella tabrizica TaxID=671278 RepID=A0ABQ2WPJ2_9ALTE|nr:hypothetical protein [Alishewanella tabrizica]GGW63720.1 hypothetical protein GCM10008111_19740 [Alishewanella tabrizica]
MVLPLIITLVIALVIIAITVNVVQQHRDRMQALKRAEFTKLRHALEETEEILVNAANVPLSVGLSLMLLRRLVYLLKAMVELEPGMRDLKQRLDDTEKRVAELAKTPASSPENPTLPDNDQQLIAMIKGIKKLRTMLRAEHARGNVDTQLVIDEDRRLDLLQLRINVESQVKRGKNARASNMLGSARQYFEKALNYLSNTNHQNDYINNRLSETRTALEEITLELKQGNARDVEKRGEKDNKDIDDLFAPKRKW